MSHSRKPTKPPSALVLFAVLLLAAGSYALFNALAQAGPGLALASTPTLTAAPSSTVTSTSIPWAAPTSTRTPLPTTSLASTATTLPTLTPASPTPIQPTTAWLTYTNMARAYQISYPNTWFLSANDPVNSIFITSFLMPASGHGGILSSSVKIDIGVSLQSVPVTLPPNSQQKEYCLDGRCGVRVDQRGPFSEPIDLGVNRAIYIQLPVNEWSYYLSAVIDDPPIDAERNAAIVEQIIASWHFVPLPSTTTPTPTAMPTVTPTHPAPVPITDAWQTAINASYGYRIRYPPNWFVRAAQPPTAVGLASYDVRFTSFGEAPTEPMSSPISPKDIPPGHAAVDILVSHGPLTGYRPVGERFCIDSVCGVRHEKWPPWSCGDGCQQLYQGVNRQIIVQLVKDDNLYQLSATINNPTDAAERYAAIAESVIQSFQFIR
jgi:hypothetical protein